MRAQWIMLPSVVGMVAAACVGLGCWTYWGPIFAIAVGLAAQATNSRLAGLFAATQAALLYDFLVLPPAFHLTLDSRSIVSAGMFFAAAVAFRRRDCGTYISDRHLNTVPEVVDWLKRSDAKQCCCLLEELDEWLLEDQIPPGWHLRLVLRAQSEGYAICPSALGLTPKGEAIMPAEAKSFDDAA